MEQTSDFLIYLGDIEPAASQGDAGILPGEGDTDLSPAGAVSGNDFSAQAAEDGTVSAETLQQYFTEQHEQYLMIRSGLFMTAAFLGLIVGFLLLQAFWSGGKH